MKVKLLPYGAALERYQQEMKRAVPCEARVTDACFNGARGMNEHLGDRCGFLAKVDIDGKRLCARHAGMITLSEAIKRNR